MDSASFVLFGGTGDLAKRKIYPALYNLFIEEKLPKQFSIIALGRSEMSTGDFNRSIEQSLTSFSRRKIIDSNKKQEFLEFFRYVALDANNKEDYKKLLKVIEQREMELNIPQNRMFYLSVGPQFFDIITQNIKESGLGSTKGWKRLIIEKPFGHDLKSAQELNNKLSKAFLEEEIYRIDHYLGKPMVQNLEALEFANPIVQALWNNKYIANVQITASETVGVEERAGYYDKFGAIRDMVQNHMLQMVMMTAMKLPENLTANEIRNEKKKVMESLRPLTKKDIVSNIIRGQYSSGVMEDKPVVGYTEEPGVQDSSMNDTFIAAKLWIDNPFWSGVPFYIRTGKRMKEKSTRIVVEFKNPTKDLYSKGDNNTPPNLLVVEINPNEGISLLLNSKNPVKEGKLEPIKIDYISNRKDIPEAYELLIYDALRGDSTFFAHWNEVELAWKWVQPILDQFKENKVPLHSYSSGSNGPEAANLLLKDDGFKWWLDKESGEQVKVTL
ncbi:glucose-6-phosphate dehydrogenase [Neobacillus terrae]|uniref:glucose-6-phosphate dehydrogenase n=1 Tax=Neobacillus terrae TaxID=3034837 RepID=UPI00140CE2AB|nr:glucose-6-phosphate dehydrogenase [Neobacillus terrae]NHM32500.1 glucose-6-phosphate dehydrogenase [Neobacillus terrae]